MPSTREWTFRAASVLLGLSVFVLFEGVCRITGWGAESQFAGPYAEFAAVRPLFRLSADQANYQVADNRRLYFAEESFPATRLPNEFRIFVFGGSTVQGRPFSIPTAFTSFMEIALQQADPDTKWTVVNCGGVSYASYRLLPIMRECLEYSPDLFIVCTGHNEYLECVTYGEARDSSSTLSKSYSWLSNLHTFHLAEQTFGKNPALKQSEKQAITLPEEVDALLDHQGGMDAFQRSQLHRDRIVTAFGDNLQEMATLTKTADVPLMFVLPPSNLRDCPPFKSEFGKQTTPTLQESIAQRLQRARNLLAADRSKAIRLLRSVTEDDPQFAMGWYQFGQAMLNANNIPEAAVALIRSRDEDICPLRMTSALEQTLSEVAVSNSVPLLNAHELLALESRNEIVGDAVLVDHIHPSFSSNQKMALAIIDTMKNQQWLNVAQPKWKSSAAQEFDRHLQSLDDLYFLRGRRTLKTLELWTQGRGDGPPLATTAEH